MLSALRRLAGLVAAFVAPSTPRHALDRVLCNLHGASTALSFGVPVTASSDARTLTGLVAPYGIPGRTSAGLLTIARDAIHVPDDLSRVKLVDNHQTPPVAVGYATAARSTDAGLEMTFTVAATEAGDRALLEASERTRDAFSVELVDLELTEDGTTVTSASLSAVAQVAIPAFADARIASTPVTPAAPAAAASQHAAATTSPRRLSALPAATAPADLAAGMTASGTAPAADVLGDMFAAMGRVMRGESSPTLEAALADVINTNVYNVVGEGSYAGQLWGNLGYTRRYVDLMTPKPLTSYKVRGWFWTTKPEVDDYTGDKAAIPSNTPAVDDRDTTASRLAGGHDLDRKFVDFGDDEFLAAYFAAMTESYARKSDAKPVPFLLANATAGGATGAGGNVLEAAVLAADVLEDQTDGMSPDYVLVNRADRRALLDMTAFDVPAFLELLGIRPDQLKPSSQVPAGTVVVGVKAAANWYELPGAPIRVNALNIANGGVDEALFGYYAMLLNDSKGIVKTTITA